MSEKIYLGFNGKENIRLGESLAVICQWKRAVNQIIGNIDINNIISNVYVIYNIKTCQQLLNYISVKSNVCLLACDVKTDVEGRNILINSLDDDMYIISIKAFKFLNEKVWPKIVGAYSENINKNASNNFLLKFNIPLSYITKMYPLDYNSFSRMFIEDVKKWLTFHFLGNIKEAKDENENLLLTLNITY